MMRDAVRAVLEALFRFLFSYDCVGEEKLPATGPAVVAANHPSYLDPVLLSLQVARPIRFMAWNALFRVPVLGWLVRLFGAFPVDVRPGQGRSAYEAARQLLLEGELVGIFPEGRRSTRGFLEPELRAGAARLALETGAPLVPATIRGAFRAWPHTRRLPGLATIRVRYHDPIDPAPLRGLPEAQAVAALLDELRRRVERSLLPAVAADRRIDALWRSNAPWPRLHEAGVAFALALLVFWKTRSFGAILPCYGYVAYLLLDPLLLPQRRLTKWVRNGSAAVFTLLYVGWALPLLGLPRVEAPGALLAMLAGAGTAYLHEKGATAQRFVQGLVAATLLELGALALARTPLGPHLALPLFAAAFAWERRTVFWRYSVPVLTAYAVFVPLWLGGGAELLPHAVAALLGWVVARLTRAGAPTGRAATPQTSPGSMLDLH